MAAQLYSADEVFSTDTGSIETATSAIQSGMFRYIVEKRRNRRVGRDSHAAVDAENGNGRG